MRNSEGQPQGGQRFGMARTERVRRGGITAPESPVRTKDDPTIEETTKANTGGYAGSTRTVERVGRNRGLKILGAVGVIGTGLGAYEAYENVPAVHQAVDSAFLDHIKGKSLSTVETRKSLGPQSNDSVSWWKEVPQEKIQSLAQIPSINILGDEHKSAVSPSLQQRATNAGYEIVYQGNPNDTAGRTVIAKGRETGNRDWTVEDLGFGKAGLTVRGIFHAWVPDPKDPNQQDHVYAFLKNPNSGEEYLVRMELQPFDPNSPIRPTWFAVDDLYNGPSQVELRSREVGREPGQELSADELPSPDAPPLKRSKKLTDFPTLNDLLRGKERINLTDLAKPGDYVRMVMQTAGVDQTKGDYMYKTDENGVPRAITFVTRRFGGEAQWKSELPTSAK